MTKATAPGFLGLLCMFLPLTSCAQDTNGLGEPRAQGRETAADYDFVEDWTNRNLYCGGDFQDFAISKAALTSLSDYDERSIIERSGYDAELVKWILFRKDLNFVIATPRSHLGPQPDLRSNEYQAWANSWSECSAKTSRIYALPGDEYVEVPFSPHCGDAGVGIGIEPSDINVTVYEVSERMYFELSWPRPAAAMLSLYQAGSGGVVQVADSGC